MLERAVRRRRDRCSGALSAAEGPGSESAEATANDRQMANVMAAILAAALTAVVESPVELFRHNQQAGLIKGDFMREMLSTVRREGPAGLYWGFLPHCFEVIGLIRWARAFSVPY